MHDNRPNAQDLPRLLPGRPGTSIEGRVFIATLKEDSPSAILIREASGETLREKDGTLIWGFPLTTTLIEVEALLAQLCAADPVDGDAAPGPATEGWNFDIDAAPRGGEKTITGKVAGSRDYERKAHTKDRIFAAGTGGVVTVSYWIPDQERWNML